MRRGLGVFLLLGMVVGSLGAQGTAAAANGATGAKAVETIRPMRVLYVQDQRDRGVAMADNGDDLKPGQVAAPAKDLSWDEISKRDAERQRQVRQMLADGTVATAQDFRDASFIFQHGQSAEDYLLAHVLAMEAIVLGDTSAKWIAAATLDRYLQAAGKKQIFGTQYLDAKLAFYYEHQGDADVVTKMQAVAPSQTQQPYNDSLIPDPLRRDFCVPDLAEQRSYVAAANAKKPVEIPRIPGCVR